MRWRQKAASCITRRRKGISTTRPRGARVSAKYWSFCSRRGEVGRDKRLIFRHGQLERRELRKPIAIFFSSSQFEALLRKVIAHSLDAPARRGFGGASSVIAQQLLAGWRARLQDGCFQQQVAFAGEVGTHPGVPADGIDLAITRVNLH